MLLSSVETFEAFLTNSVYQDQTVPVGAVLSGSTLFASIFYMLSTKQTFQDVIILLAL